MHLLGLSQKTWRIIEICLASAESPEIPLDEAPACEKAADRPPFPENKQHLQGMLNSCKKLK